MWRQGAHFTGSLPIPPLAWPITFSNHIPTRTSIPAKMQHTHAHFDKVVTESDRPGQGGHREAAREVGVCGFEIHACDCLRRGDTN